MKSAWPAGGELQPRRWNVPEERLDVGPRDEIAVLGVVSAEATGEEPPEARTQARIDARHPPGVVLAHQLDLPRLDQPGRGDVDQAAVEHVVAEQQLIRAALELGPVQPRGGGL